MNAQSSRELVDLHEIKLLKEQVLLRKRNRIWHETWRKPTPRHDECIILANGGSVQGIQEELANYAKKADIFTMNNSLKNEFTRSLKPIVHILADPIYTSSDSDLTPRQLQTKTSTFSCLESTEWEIQLAVPYSMSLNLRQNFFSPLIHVSGFPTETADAKLPLNVQYKLAEAGLAGFGAQCVAVPALYIALVTGYKTIWLAGMDADWSIGLRVDQHCNLYLDYSHFYQDNRNVRLRGRVQDEYRTQYIYHVQMDSLRSYADWLGTRVINLSLSSHLDMFPKGVLGKKPFTWKPEN